MRILKMTSSVHCYQNAIPLVLVQQPSKPGTESEVVNMLYNIEYNESNMAKKEAEDTMDVLKEYNLSLEQEMFCQYFTSPTEFFGNGVQSYASAYNVDLNTKSGYNSAKSSATRALKNPKILRRINDLIEAAGLNDINVDKQLYLLLNQNADYKAKLGAIREYNKLKQRITEKVEHTIKPPVTKINIVSAEDDIAEQLAAQETQNDTTGTITTGEGVDVEGNEETETGS